MHIRESNPKFLLAPIFEISENPFLCFEIFGMLHTQAIYFGVAVKYHICLTFYFILSLFIPLGVLKRVGF
jgi:hypothetical protein